MTEYDLEKAIEIRDELKGLNKILSQTSKGKLVDNYLMVKAEDHTQKGCILSDTMLKEILAVILARANELQKEFDAI